jgi:hypothetical protein
MGENYFAKVLIPLKRVLCPVGILQNVQLAWVRKTYMPIRALS